MPSSDRRAKIALCNSLRNVLADDVASRFVGGTHTRRFADNLLQGFSQGQIATLREQLEGGAGGELRATKTGKRPAHAPYSSAMLAVNAFGGWLGREAQLRVAGIGGFTSQLELESRQRIGHGGGTANLDVLLRTDAIVVGVESKLTEPLRPHDPVKWRAPYHDAKMSGLLNGGWSDVFAASKDGRWQPRYVGVEQLIKHALALASRFQGKKLHLVYVWWEPDKPSELPELAKHRDELADLRDRLGDASPRLHALTYAELFREWGDLGRSSFACHLDQLAQRYSISVRSAFDGSARAIGSEVARGKQSFLDQAVALSDPPPARPTIQASRPYIRISSVPHAVS